MTISGRGTDAALRDRLAAAVPGLDPDELPRRFLLVDYTDDSLAGSPVVTACGLRFADAAIVVHPDRTVSQFVGAHRAFVRLVESSDRIVWLDEPAAPHTE